MKKKKESALQRHRKQVHRDKRRKLPSSSTVIIGISIGFLIFFTALQLIISNYIHNDMVSNNNNKVKSLFFSSSSNNSDIFSTATDNKKIETTKIRRVDNDKIINAASTKLKQNSLLSSSLDIVSLVKSALGPKQDINSTILSNLPSASEVQSLYGDEPLIYGLETCRTYQNSVSPPNRYLAPAGLFNTGTNLLEHFLSEYCKATDKKRRSSLWQAPWGKHSPASWHGRHFAKLKFTVSNHSQVLPIVMIKDPLFWMASMCRVQYAATWRHNAKHCPNLIPNKFDQGRYKDGVIRASVMYSKKDNNFTYHDSLLHIWIDYYLEWMHRTPYPRLIIRYEDLLFRPEQIMGQICECGGQKLGVPPEEVRQVVRNAKGEIGPHKGGAGLVEAIMKYGNSTRRKGILWDPSDLEFARKELKKADMLETFRYNMP